MRDLIDREAFIEQERKVYCENCDRRQGMKNGKLTFCYEIGDAPCRACWGEDILTDLEDFPAAPRWHRVEEELPKEKNWVLVWHTGYATPKKAKFIVDVIPEFLFDGGGGAWELDGWSDNKGKVTHWMPLPEPPKEEKP